MSVLRRLWWQLSALVRKRELDDEFDEEARLHLDLAIDDYLQQGVSRPDAERLARAKFGLVASAREAHRDARSFATLDALVFDVNQAWRSLRRDRGFAFTAIVTLAVALALNATLFVVMDAVLFRGLPLVKRNDRLLFLQERGPSGQCCLSYLDFEDWRSQARSFEGLAFVRSASVTLQDADGRHVDMRASQISANSFSLLGVSPALGRDFVPSDEQPGAPQVIILSHRFWQSRFHGRDDVIGAQVRLNERPATIIGVMPERFEFPLKIEGSFWSPVSNGPELRKRGLPGGGFTAVGRLRDDATADEARAELETINRRLAADYPDTNRHIVPTAVTHAVMNSGEDATMIWGSLWVASCFVLFIACINVANLTMVRTIGRWREFATRLALGAGPVRMVRQLITEAMSIGAVATVFALALSVRAVGVWDAITASQYQVLDYSFTSSSLAYLVIVGGLVTVAMSIPPATRVLRAGSRAALKGDARGVTAGLRGKQLGIGLVALQMALAIVLLCGAGVLLRSFTNIVGADTGVRDPERVLTGLMRMPSATYEAGVRYRYLERLEAALRTTPGIDRVALATSMPVKYASGRNVEIEGRPHDRDDESAGFVRATADYFAVLGLAPLTGRAFSVDDRSNSLPVAIVNQSFAHHFWPGQDAVGRRIRAVTPAGADPWRLIVGVVPDTMHNDALRQTFKPIVYVPLAQETTPLVIYWLASTTVTNDRVVTSVRAAVEGVDPDVPLSQLQTLRDSFAFDRDFMDAEHSELGKYAKVAPIFAVIAIVLSAVGLIAVISHAVTQRTNEIGVRMAIGATAADIRGLVLREGLLPVAVGIVTGVALSMAVNRMLQSQLVGISPYDAPVMVGAPLILTLIAMAANLVPARQAVAVDPIVALKKE